MASRASASIPASRQAGGEATCALRRQALDDGYGALARAYNLAQLDVLRPPRQTYPTTLATNRFHDTSVCQMIGDLHKAVLRNAIGGGNPGMVARRPRSMARYIRTRSV